MRLQKYKTLDRLYNLKAELFIFLFHTYIHVLICGCYCCVNSASKHLLAVARLTRATSRI